ncbi:MAG: hypothetical protein F6J93_04575 [Oscillatoria sp. SIO1A7]|nr:hypothetical protein [Oscillatoria sp. SIO1A7]
MFQPLTNTSNNQDRLNPPYTLHPTATPHTLHPPHLYPEIILLTSIW